MSKVYAADSAHKEKILSDLKTVVNDLTGIKPEDVDIHAHFLEVGIDSLTLIQATQLVKELFDVKLSVVQLLEQLTNLDALASYIAQQVPVQSLPQTAAAPVAAPQEQPQAVSTRELVAPPPAPPVASPVAQVQSYAAPVSYTPVQAITSEVKPVEVQPLRPLNGGEQAGTSALDQIMSQQLQLMAQQLEMLHAYHASAVPAAQSNAVPAASVEAATPVIETPAVPVAAAPHMLATAPVTTTEPEGAPEPASANTTTPSVKQQPIYIAYQPIEPGPTTGLTPEQQQHLDHLITRFNARTRESKRQTQAYRPYLSDSRNSFGFR